VLKPLILTNCKGPEGLLLKDDPDLFTDPMI